MPFFVLNQQNSKTLNFKPRRPVISAVAFYWEDHLLNKDAQADAPKVDLTATPLDDVLFELFGELSFMETYSLHHACKSQPKLALHLDWSAFFKKQNRFWNDKVALIFEQLQKCPLDFLKWCEEKKIEGKDLYPLLSLKESPHWAEFKTLAPLWKEQNLSRNDGKVALDLTIDLLLMDRLAKELLPNGASLWLKQLKQMRNPRTTLKDQRETADSWPQYVKVKKQRQGDRLLQQLEISFLNNEDLQKKLGRLIEKVAQK